MTAASSSERKPLRTLVTGGGGFLGGAIVEQLLARGDIVRSFARTDYHALTAMGVEHICGDLLDPSAVRDACDGCDVVFHVAAKSGIWGSYDDYYAPNVRGTQNIIAACRQLGVGRLVYTSSPSVVFHGGSVRGVDESLPYPRRYVSNYSATKAAAERAVLAANSNGLFTVALRPHLIWGPGDNHMLPRFVAQARAGKLRRLGRGQNRIDTTYIEDAARAHLLAAEALRDNPRARGHAFFISQDDPRPVWDIINGMLAAAGVSPVTRSVPRWVGWTAGAVFEAIHTVFRIQREPRMTRFVASVLYTDHWFDISAAKKELGYQPAVTIEEGMKRLERWMKSSSSRYAR